MSSVEIDSLVGHYRIRKMIGAGGMGEVFLAEDVHLRRKVALKVMQPRLLRHPGAKDRFLREARSMASLKSEYIVTIHHVGEDQGRPYFVMPLLEGMTLEKYLESGKKLTPKIIVRLAAKICKGLIDAHKKGLIHRDIKPNNVYLEAPRGKIKILDFGLARPIEAATRPLTKPGDVMGTPHYMAPEQAAGATVDERVDLFSLGVMIYQMVSKKLPFDGDTVYQVLLALGTHTPPSLSEIQPQIPKSLSRLVDRLLEKKPQDRPANAKEVLEQLQRIDKELSRTTLLRQDREEDEPDLFADFEFTNDSSIKSSRGKGWIVGLVTGAFAIVVGVILALGGRGNPKEEKPIEEKKSNENSLVDANTKKKDNLLKETGKDSNKISHNDAKSTVLFPQWEGLPTNPIPGEGIQVPIGESNGQVIAMKFCWIPPNKKGIKIGSSPEQMKRVRENLKRTNQPTYEIKYEAEQEITIERGFFLGKYEVTQEEYRSLMNENPSFFTPQNDQVRKAEITDTSRFPVENVSWRDAKDFCQKLTDRYRKQGLEFTLPDLKEFEYANRGGKENQTDFYWGNELNGTQANCDGQYPFGTEIKGPYLERTTYVGSYEKEYPHPWGLCDTVGNVREWTNYAFNKGSDLIVFRGGGWPNNPVYCRPAYGSAIAGSSRNNDLGFRVCLKPPVRK